MKTLYEFTSGLFLYVLNLSHIVAHLVLRNNQYFKRSDHDSESNPLIKQSNVSKSYAKCSQMKARKTFKVLNFVF